MYFYYAINTRFVEKEHIMTKDIFPYKRTGRKACLMDKTEKNLGFNFYEELAIYKFAMGLSLSKKEEKIICAHVRFDTYLQWEEYFEKKYRVLDTKKKKEFQAIIDIMESRRKMTKSVNSIILPAFFTMVSEQLIRYMQSLVECGEKYSSFIFVVVTLMLLAALAISFSFLVINIISVFSKDAEEVQFCKTLKKIVNKM